jgi:Aldehyde dehydrogenase family
LRTVGALSCPRCTVPWLHGTPGQPGTAARCFICERPWLVAHAGSDFVDCGAMCLPGLAEQVHALVEDACTKGARVLTGGKLPAGPGQFYPPTILADVTPNMRVWREETFGPLMTVTKCTSDEHAVRAELQRAACAPCMHFRTWQLSQGCNDLQVQLANDCQFGLGSACFSGSQRRASAIGKQLNTGMFVANDFASNAMCQSLPFGGVKESGFDRCASGQLCLHMLTFTCCGLRFCSTANCSVCCMLLTVTLPICAWLTVAFCRFGGVEGLRGMCYPKVIVEDRFPSFMRTAIPPPLQYPVAPIGFSFVHALCKMFYGSSIYMQLSGLVSVIKMFMLPPATKSKVA